MSTTPDQTPADSPKFDFSAFPADTLFLDRRTLPTGDVPPDDLVARAPRESKPRKERRRRVDPTTFEKQYTEDEMAFMNAVQRFKIRSGKMFPSHGDILRVALSLGYRQFASDEADEDSPLADLELASLHQD